MGLPSGLLWATRNIGAEAPTGRGLYFSWANVEGHTADSGYDFSLEVYEGTPGYSLETDITPEYDAANVILGNGWRMPANHEYRELIDNCDFSSETINDVPCIVASSRVNGKRLILPAHGGMVGTQLSDDGTYAMLWTTRIVSELAAFFFYATIDGTYTYSGHQRRLGCNIRPVRYP